MAKLTPKHLLTALAVALGAAAGCANNSGGAQDSTLVTDQRSQASPSGAFTASVDVVDDHGTTAWRVVLRDRQQREVYRSSTAFAVRHRTLITWDQNADQLWVYSGDLGTRVFTHDDQGTWTDRPGRGMPPPPAIQKIHDQLGISSAKK